MTQKVVASSWWMLTSPHRVLSDSESKFLDRMLKNRNIVYDYCRAVEVEPGADVPHTHVAIRFCEPIIPWFGGASANLHGWNIECPSTLSGDESWELMLQYVKKNGNYEHLREIIPFPYNVEHPVWKPWQQYVLDLPRFDRKIIIVVDRIGGIGKTFLAGWFDVRHRAVLVPPMESHRDIMRMIYAQDVVGGLVFIDIPRALSKRQMRAIYAAAESVKDGKVYDERYQWRVRRFDTPKVVVFTNDEPDRSQLSRDRWLVIYPRGDGSFSVDGDPKTTQKNIEVDTM